LAELKIKLAIKETPDDAYNTDVKDIEPKASLGFQHLSNDHSEPERPV